MIKKYIALKLWLARKVDGKCHSNTHIHFLLIKEKTFCWLKVKSLAKKRTFQVKILVCSWYLLDIWKIRQDLTFKTFLPVFIKKSHEYVSMRNLYMKIQGIQTCIYYNKKKPFVKMSFFFFETKVYSFDFASVTWRKELVLSKYQRS